MGEDVRPVVLPVITKQTSTVHDISSRANIQLPMTTLKAAKSYNSSATNAQQHFKVLNSTES